jgi:hypothetical protein
MYNRFLWFAKCCHTLFQIQTLSWDCPFSSRKSKQFNLVSKALENMIRASYTLKLRSFCFFYWTIGNWSADRLNLSTCVLPKTLDEISWSSMYTGRTAFRYVCAECTTAVSGLPNHFLNFDSVLWQNFEKPWNRFYINSPPVCTIVAIKGPI